MGGSDGITGDRIGGLGPGRSDAGSCRFGVARFGYLHPGLIALGLCAAVLVAASILTVTFCLLLTPVPTSVFSGWFADDASSTASHDELVRVAVETLAYVNGDDDADLPLGYDDTVSYTPEIMSHLDDVKRLFDGVKIGCAACLATLVAALLALRWRCRRPGSPIPFGPMASFVMSCGVAILVIALIVLMLAAVIDFGSLFDFLHSLFFEGGTWTFPADSLLICALPESLWMAMGALWAAFVIASCVVLLACTRLVRFGEAMIVVRKTIASRESDVSVADALREPAHLPGSSER